MKKFKVFLKFKAWWQSSGWGTRGVSPRHPSLSSTHQTGCMWMTELQEAAGACPGDQQSPPILTPDLSSRWHELRPEAAQAETTVFLKSCPGQLYTLDLTRSALTPRTNLHRAQVLLEVIWASLPSGQQAGAYQLPFHSSFYFFSFLLTADSKHSPLS